MEGSAVVGAVFVGLVVLAPAVSWLRRRRMTGSRADAFDRTPDPVRTLTELNRLNQRSDY